MRCRILTLSFIFSFVLGQNYSLSFDGVDDYVSTGPWFSGVNNDYTLMVNFRFNQSPDETDEYLLLHKGHFQDKGIFVGIPYDGTADTSIVGFDRDPGSWINVIYNDFVVNHWYNVAFTANDDSLKLYVDLSRLAFLNLS